MVVPGRDCIGIGVGAVVFDGGGCVFLARRGHAARNEIGAWEFPGGSVRLGERLEDAVRREFREEYGLEISLTSLLGVFDHILVSESQHWVSVTYLARSLPGVPAIREPGKCSEIGWFSLSSLPVPLSKITCANVFALKGAH
ncbi:NUDIX domain-containing protein [Spirillospora sp. NPDC048824]|uniref:NUDIX domain-containing protein n=1 Tax=Spirillospora sp. NPDC048824 TaxID=3364526 RepID=UPI00371FF661